MSEHDAAPDRDDERADGSGATPLALPPAARALQEALAAQYTLERELGRGGMATVYLAHDLKHDRPVALKVLHSDLGAALGPERFRREITTAARLQHPHILGVLDSGETRTDAGAGRLWFTMPYVEGESLRDRLNREGQLPVRDAVRIAREAALALDFAHRHGIIHRDVKPENILLTDGQALVADFGIARALQEGGEGAARAPTRLTGTGLAVGTPAYMSPEQSAGEREVDARTDVYALGAVLFEMLTGEPPFTGATPQVVITKRLSTPAPSVRVARPSVSPALEAVVARALATAPADRFQSAAEVADALEAVTTGATHAGGAAAPALSGAPDASAAPPVARTRRSALVWLVVPLLVLAGGGLTLWWHGRTPGTASAPDVSATAAGPTRLAVLPFDNLGRPADAYVVDGITDEIRDKLSSVPGLQVIARASSNQYRTETKSPQQIAQELGVRYLLTGTVRSEPGPAGHPARVRVAPELVSVTAQSAPVNRWAQTFDAQVQDVFAMQADIASRVASAMNVALGTATQAKLAEAPTRNPAAYDAYLRGEAAASALSNPDPVSLRRALGYYAQAVTLDSAFADAWAQRSRAASLLYFDGVPTPALAREARTAADRASALAPSRPAGDLALGDYDVAVEKDYPRALAAYAAGRRLAPNDAELLAGVAYAEQSLGRAAEAVRDFHAAAALDPRSAITARRLAFMLLWVRRYPEARAAADRALALAPTDPAVLETRAMVDLAEGDLAGARRVLAAAPAGTDRTALLAMMGTYWDLYWLLDDAQQRQLLTLRPEAFDNDRGAWGWVMAQTYALRGDSARARAYADSARVAVEAQLREAPNDAERRLFHGLALAMLGRTADAVHEAERGVALAPVSRYAYAGAYLQHQLARVYLMVGQPDKAVDVLEALLRMPYYLSPAWLRIDPEFASLRGNPRFERLIAAH